MLVGSGVRTSGNPMRSLCWGPGSIERATWRHSGALRNLSTHAGAYAALPNGHLAPSAWLLPRIGGGMSAYTSIDGAGGVAAANLAGGLNAEAALSGSGQIALAGLVPVIQAVAALAGTGALSGDITGKLEAVAALAGVGGITFANLSSLLNASATLVGSGALTADIAGSLNAAASLAGLGEITNADANMIVLAAAALAGIGAATGDITGAWFMQGALGGDSTLVAGIQAPAHLDAVLVGAGSLTATAFATGDMSAQLSVSATEELTANAVALAVWQYATRTLTGAGTLTPEQETQLFELWQMSGLDPDAPVSATPTRRFVGDSGSPDIDQTITGNGRTQSTITRT